MAKSDKKNDKKDKTKGDKKAKKGKGGTGEGVSVAAHPRAAAQVRRAKGTAGVGFFALGAYLSYKANVPAYDVALRALAIGIVGYMLAWACSVTVWRHLVMAELRHAVESGRATFEAKSGQPAPDAAAAGNPDTGGE